MAESVGREMPIELPSERASQIDSIWIAKAMLLHIFATWPVPKRKLGWEIKRIYNI